MFVGQKQAVYSNDQFEKSVFVYIWQSYLNIYGSGGGALRKPPKKTSVFLIFSGDIKMEHRPKIDRGRKRNQNNSRKLADS